MTATSCAQCRLALSLVLAWLVLVLLALLGTLAWLQFGVLGKRVHYR